MGCEIGGGGGVGKFGAKMKKKSALCGGGFSLISNNKYIGQIVAWL